MEVSLPMDTENSAERQSRYAREFINTSHKIGYLLIIKILILHLGNNAEYLAIKRVMKRICFRIWFLSLHVPLPKCRGVAQMAAIA
ncbi:hypothetical protein P3W43_06515 [Salinicola salarius]|uniref:hypothetical protein n=1 Tax=Salinicola salarius TaxID=430457 RepID=UPI0023E427BD|nr:hypothetical protein [Salinicola salarius]MDF3918506.1 hypothetical protein [Salinicola salarius]